MLARIWPAEQWLWHGRSTSAIKLYRWRSICAYIGSDIAGHIARMDFTLWLHGKPQTIAGIASVATDPAHRRKGIAKQLLYAILKTIDADQLPAALFTDIPAVYQPHGFQTVPQNYRMVNPSSFSLQPSAFSSSFSPQEYDTIGPEQIASLARIYEHHYPDYHGKIVRDPDYWTCYVHLFNHNPKARITLYRDNQKIRGYTRIHQHPTHPILTEFCCPPDDSATITTMLAGLQTNTEILLALPPQHFILQPSSLIPSLPLIPQPSSLKLECFMLRPNTPSSFCLHPSSFSLTWPLADKF